MFKEAEKGNKEINVERTEDALETNASIIATGCPFCNTMFRAALVNIAPADGGPKLMDIAQIAAASLPQAPASSEAPKA